MRNARYLMLVALVVLSAATVGRADDTLRECSVYPLAVGTEWVYAMGPVEMLERVTAHEMVGEELCAKLETVYNGKVIAFEHITVREDGVYRVSVAGQSVEPAFCLLKWPAEEGDEWEVASTIQEQSLSGSFAVSLGDVTVPAGEYQTVHVESAGFSVPQEDGTTIPLQFSYDFATGVGKVKQVVQIGEMSTEMELKEVTLP
jgi:hypothetical protein